MAEFIFELPASRPPSEPQTPATDGVIDHVADGLDRLVYRFQKPRIKLLLAAFLKPMQPLEQLFADIIASRNVDVATGVALELLAKLVGQKVLPLTDEVFRRYIKARIRTNKSRGVGPDIVQIIRLVLGVGNGTLNAHTDRFATYTATIDGTVLDVATGDAISSFLDAATGDGIRYVLEAPVSDDDEAVAAGADGFFTFDGAIAGRGFASYSYLYLKNASGVVPGAGAVNIDSLVRSVISGQTTYRLAFVADGGGMDSVTSAGDDWTLHFTSGVTTVLDAEGLIDGTGVFKVHKASATPSALLSADPGGDEFPLTSLSDGDIGGPFVRAYTGARS